MAILPLVSRKDCPWPRGAEIRVLCAGFRAPINWSCYSASAALTKLRAERRLGKTPTSSVRRGISLFSRSWGLLDHSLCQWATVTTAANVAIRIGLSLIDGCL